MIERDTVVTRSGGLLESQIDDELVALDVERGLCFGLDSIGARIWQMLEQHTTAARICADLTEAYEVPEGECLRDVLALLHELEESSLIAVIK